MGPLEVRLDGQNMEIGGLKRRLVLATLLLNANRLVTFDRLIKAVWPIAPPRSAVANLYTYMAGLRSNLPSGKVRIRTRSSGYSIAVQPHEFDLHTFERLTAEAALLRAEGRQAEAADLLQRALALWRGEPLEDLSASPVWEASVSRLTEARLAAAEKRLRLLVELGQYATAISEAQILLHGHPFRERAWEQLMLALYHSGRRAEALQVYVDVRRRLVEEMGVEPGPELHRAHAEILAGEHLSDDPMTATEVFPVCQLPPDIPDFSGRTGPVRELAGMLSGGHGTDTVPTTVVVMGPPGVGKSSLALHVAHTVRTAFPHGQLYADLAGTTHFPREPSALLAEALRALGVTGTAIPKSLGERAALYRTRLADRRVLVVLDDAVNAAQVQPLLPATAGCAVLVTSRNRLAELPGARPVVLDVLSAAEGRELIGRIVGADRTGREPEETDAIVHACGYLPLAIRIAGAKLAGRKTWALRVLRERLADESRRVSELQVGDLGVRAGFETSMRMLPTDAARALRLLGMLDAQTFPGWVIDALLDRHPANDVLDTLLDAHLLQLADVDETGQPRYRLHDLIRAYAREAAVTDPPQLRRTALTRVLGGWLALAEQAADRLPATVNRAVLGDATRWRLVSEVTNQLVAAPRYWFEAERRSLLTAVALAAEHGLDGFAWELAACLVPYFDQLSLYEDWRCCHLRALSAVRAAGNRRGEAVLLRGLGQIDIYTDDYERAKRNFERSRELSREIGDRRGEAWAVAGLGTIDRLLDRYEEAVTHYLEALSAFAGTDERHLEAQIRNSIGAVRLAQGQPDEACGWLDEALRIAQSAGDDFRTATVLVNIGQFYMAGNEPLQALAHQQHALATMERIGDEQRVAYTLLNLGETHAALEETAKAVAAGDRAKAIFARTGNQSGEAACNRLLDKLARSYY